MNKLKKYFGLITIIFTLNFSQISMGKQKIPENVPTRNVTCREAFENVGKIKAGMTDTEVLELLGKPNAIEKTIWGYNFLECAPKPKVGQQIVIGLEITFEEKIIKKIDYATICITGMPISTPQKPRRKKSN
ncbi:hypothetical protein BH10ACI1_BH10ACI1_21400 [soil metagenome]